MFCVIFFYSGFLPVIKLYKILIIAITNKICIKFPVAIPAIMPKKPSNQTTMQITATNHNILLIIFVFLVRCKTREIVKLQLTLSI